MTDLTADEIERYARHIVLHEFGGAGQQALKASTILVIGAGGLGAPAMMYLAAAGVGTIHIVDDDTVSLSNLQRQIIHDSDTVGETKVSSAASALARINPHTHVITTQAQLRSENARDLISQVDLVLDGSDNFDTRYLVAEECETGKIPLVTGAVGRFDGSVTVLRPWETGEDGALNPRYIDLFPQRPADGSVPTCAEAGVLGALTGVIGAMMAMEAIKDLTGVGKTLIRQLLLYDGLTARTTTIHYKRPGTPGPAA
ncbi:MAG: molybdopterin-synthase adenylyltransferase MoeB [Pseudomonadota bacterium]